MTGRFVSGKTSSARVGFGQGLVDTKGTRALNRIESPDWLATYSGTLQSSRPRPHSGISGGKTREPTDGVGAVEFCILWAPIGGSKAVWGPGSGAAPRHRQLPELSPQRPAADRDKSAALRLPSFCTRHFRHHRASSRFNRRLRRGRRKGAPMSSLVPDEILRHPHSASQQAPCCFLP